VAARPALLRDGTELNQSTVSENVVECGSEPDVAVTVTVEVTGWIGGAVVVPLLLPQQPLSRPSPMKATVSSKSSWMRRRFLQPKPHKRAASAASAINRESSSAQWEHAWTHFGNAPTN